MVKLPHHSKIQHFDFIQIYNIDWKTPSNSKSSTSLDKFFQQLIPPTEEKQTSFYSLNVLCFCFQPLHLIVPFSDGTNSPQQGCFPRGVLSVQACRTRATCLLSVGLDSHTAQLPLASAPTAPDGHNHEWSARGLGSQACHRGCAWQQLPGWVNQIHGPLQPVKTVSTQSSREDVTHCV